MLRTGGNHSLIPTDCKVLHRNTWRPGEREKDMLCCDNDTHLRTNRNAHCSRADMEVKEHRDLLLCRVPLWPVGWRRESGCLATSQLHGLPRQQGESPFRLSNLCRRIHHRGVAGDSSLCSLQTVLKLNGVFLNNPPAQNIFSHAVCCFRRFCDNFCAKIAYSVLKSATDFKW